MQHLVEQLGGQLETFGDVLDRWRRFAVEEMFARDEHHAARHPFAAGLVDAFAGALLEIGMDVLGGKRYLGAKQDDQPREIQPEQQHRQGAEPAVDLAVGDDAGDVEGAEGAVQLPERAADHAADERGFGADMGVGHQGIHRGKRQPEQDVRCQVQHDPLDPGDPE